MYKLRFLLIAFLGIWLMLWLCLTTASVYRVITQWVEGQDGGGDLKQHYAVGLMLKEEPENGYYLMYRDYYYMDWVIRLFHKDLYEAKVYNRDHNYRYGPLVAKMSQWSLLLPYNYWPLLWFLLSIAFGVMSYVLLQKSISGMVDDRVLWLLVVFGYPSSVYILSLFQNSFASLLILCGAGYLLSKDKSICAGLLFGLIFYKPQILVYVTGFVFFAGNWRFAVGAGLSSSGMMLLSLIVCGWESHVFWVQSLFEIMRGIQGDEMRTNIPWKGFVLTALPQAWHKMATVGTNVMMLLAFVGSIFLIWRSRKKNIWREANSLYWGAMFWVLFSPHVKVYELSLALPCWFLTTTFSFESSKQMKQLVAFHILFWISGFLGLFCRYLDISVVAPFLTIWYILVLWRMCENGRSEQSEGVKTN